MRTRAMLLPIVLSIAIAIPAFAQNAPSGGGGGVPGGRAGGGMVDPATIQLKIVETIKTKLAPTNDEWKKLRPLIERVQEAQRNTRTGAGMSFGTGPMMKGMINGKPIDGAAQGNQPPAAPGGKPVTGGMQFISGGGANVDTLPGQAMQDLRSSIEANASEEDIAARIKTFHEQRDLAKADLVKAQKELREVCNKRQEAILISLGQLD